MKIETIRDVFIKGEFVAAKSTISVEDSLGRDLIAMKKAIAADKAPSKKGQASEAAGG